MGNQEAKQRKAAATSDNASYPSLDDSSRDGGWDMTKKGGKKLQNKHGCKGAASSGGGGMCNIGIGKKKNKSESKSSVFSIRKKKTNLKGKGELCSSITSSKEDVLASQHDELDSTKTPDLSADELGHSDTEVAFLEKKKICTEEKKDGEGGKKQYIALTEGTSPIKDAGRKGGSSGSDTDMYSFHSATDHEDLLADIQLTIRLQHQQQQGCVNSISEAQEGGDVVLGRGQGGGQGGGQQNGPMELSSELELGSDALSFLETTTLSCSVRHTDQPSILHLPVHTSMQGRWEEDRCQELNGEGQKEREKEESLCVATETKDQHDWLQQPSHTAITMVTNGGAAVSPVAMTTTDYSFPASFDSVWKTQEEEGKECESGLDVDFSYPSAGSHSKRSRSPEPQKDMSSESMFEEGKGQLRPNGGGTSAESCEDCLSTRSQVNHFAVTNASSSLVVQQDRSSVCSTQLYSQENPMLTSHLLRSKNSSSSPVVKPHPPIFPTYIKTTTRQLSSPGQSPALSPSHSPLLQHRAQQHLHRYPQCCSMLNMIFNIFNLILCCINRGLPMDC